MFRGPAHESARPFLFRQLLALKEAQGFVSDEQVAVYAVALDRAPRTVWRWLREGKMPARERAGLTLDDEVRKALYESRGNITLAAERLRKARGTEEGLSRRNVCRVVNESLPADERAFLRGGAKARLATRLVRRVEVDGNNELWSTDDKELSVWVIPPDGGEPIRPWLTSVLDNKSRYAPGWLARPAQPNSAHVIETFYRAFSRSGLVPLSMRFDNGTNFHGDVVADALAQLEIQPDLIAAYSPNQNGKVERLNRTIEDRFSSQQPAFEHGPRQRNRELYTSREHAAPWDVFLEDLDAFFHWYNHEHEHAALDGRHPAEVFAEDAGAGRVVDPSELTFMLQFERAHVAREGIKLRRRKYFAAALAPHVKKKADVAVFETDPRSIEVFIDGEYLGPAVHQALVSEAEQERATKLQSRRNLQMGARMKQANGARLKHQTTQAKKASCFVAPEADELVESARKPLDTPAELADEFFDVEALNGDAA